MMDNSIKDIELRMEEKGGAIVQLARTLVIHDPDSYLKADALRGQAKSHVKTVEALLEEPTRKALDAHRSLTALRTKLCQPANDVVRAVDQKMLAWNAEQERIRAEAQRKAEEAARKEAEKVREAEARAAEREAARLAKKGQEDAAEEARIRAQEVREAPLAPAPVVVQSQVPTGGAVVRKVWKGELLDLKALAGAVAQGRAPLNLITVNQSALDDMAKAMKQELQAQIPGIRAVEVASMAGRGR